MNQSRVNNSIRNIFVSLSSQVVNYIFKFLTRTIFINHLGKEILGLNGLFISILYFLSFSELGISTAVGYLLYKPLAENDKNKISALMRVLRNSYWTIGIIITILGFLCIPFMNIIIKDYEMNAYTYLCFIVFMLTSSLSYIFSYKSTLLIIDQKEYIFSIFTLVFCIIQNILQIICLIMFNSYLYYLIVALVSVLLLNYSISCFVDKKYSYIKNFKNNNLDTEIKKSLVPILKASAFNNIGSSILSSSDNIIYSSLFGLAVVGEISNYTLICTSAFLINSRIINAITPSIGNYCAVENKEKHFTIFSCTMLFIYFVCSLISLVLLSSIQDIIELWIGKQFLISFDIVFFIILNYFCISLAGPIYTFQVTCGFADRLVFKRVFQVIINIVLSIVLGVMIGVKGVIIATIISFALTVFWLEPNLVFKEGFGLSILIYFKKYTYYLFAFLCEFAIVFMINKYIDIIFNLNILRVVIKISCSLLVCLLLNIIFTINLDENKILRIILLTKIKEYVSLGILNK